MTNFIYQNNFSTIILQQRDLTITHTSHWILPLVRKSAVCHFLFLPNELKKIFSYKSDRREYKTDLSILYKLCH